MATLLEAMLDQQAKNQATTLGNIQQIGAMQSLQANAQKAQREAAYRQAIMGARTPEEQMNVAAQYGGPDAVMKAREMQITSQARIDAQKEANQAKLEQQKALADARLEQQTMFATQMHEYRMAQARTADERAAETKRHNEQIEAFQKQNAATNEELKRLGLQLQKDKADQAQQAGVQKQTQQLGTALERANLPEADATLRGVEDAMKKRPDLVEYLSGPKSLLPDALVDPDIRAGRQAFQKLFNITLKNRSGAAVTNQEMDRLKAEFGAGAFKTPDQLQTAVNQARNIFGQHYRSVASGFGTDALNAYNANMRGMGGTPLLEPQATPTTPSSGQIGNLPPPPPGFKVNK